MHAMRDFNVMGFNEACISCIHVLIIIAQTSLYRGRMANSVSINIWSFNHTIIGLKSGGTRGSESTEKEREEEEELSGYFVLEHTFT